MISQSKIDSITLLNTSAAASATASPISMTDPRENPLSDGFAGLLVEGHLQGLPDFAQLGHFGLAGSAGDRLALLIGT
jgi:hypothetical protein